MYIAVTKLIPIDSAPPGHFCLANCPLLVVGQAIFQSTSTSWKHEDEFFAM